MKAPMYRPYPTATSDPLPPSGDEVTILTADVMTGLASLPDHSIHTIITSPPYFGLRDYAIAPTIWEPVQYAPLPSLPSQPIPAYADLGLFASCTHVWDLWTERHDQREETRHGKTRTTDRCYGDASRRFNGNHQKHTHGQFCRMCGAWRGCLGQEPSLELYVGHLVQVFRAVRRVLRPDGTLWLNLGDSYAGGGHQTRATDHVGLGPKNLMGVPWRVAFGLQADGWILRSDIVWAKRNPLPESVKDRPTRSHEMVFLLTPSSRYYYDHIATREPHSAVSVARQQRRRSDHHKWHDGGPGGQTIAKTLEHALHPNGRNKRDVWWLGSAPYKGAHFATFPPTLVEPMIRGGTPDGGGCACCGAPARRRLVRTCGDAPIVFCGSSFMRGKTVRAQGSQRPVGQAPRTISTTHIGWEPTCACRAPLVAATVLDPFGGAGTTALVAQRLGRRAILIEANPESVVLARDRLAAYRKSGRR